jgi:hypothetical protein
MRWTTIRRDARSPRGAGDLDLTPPRKIAAWIATAAVGWLVVAGAVGLVAHLG